MEPTCWVAATGGLLSLRPAVMPPTSTSLYSLFFLITVVAASFDFVVKPEFGESSSDLNVTAFAGQTGRLPCTVKHLAGKRVSWIRGRDLQVLSTGRITFSTDLRIAVLPGTTKYKSRKSRDVSHQLCRGRVHDMPNSTHGGGPSAGHQGHHSHTCVNSERKLVINLGSTTQTHRDTTTKTPDVSRAENIHKSYLYNSRRRRYIKKQNEKDGESHRRSGQSGVRSVPNRRKRRGGRREQDIFKHWNTEYHHHHHHNTKKGRDTFSNLLQYAGRAHSSSSSDDQIKTAEPQAYAQYNSPIAIYPQGPFAQGIENKGAQPGLNYIEGVWEPEDYTLQIKSIKIEDAGTYICQINTEPRISQVVHLNVVKMRAEIVGSKELYVKAGTPVSLACRVNHGTLMPGYILWYKGERLVEYDTSGGRIQVVTETDGVSHLLLKDAHPSDSANYTCSPSSGTPASLLLNVIVDERPAAMQQGNSAPHLSSSSSVLVFPVGVLATLITSITHHHHHALITTTSSTVVGALLWCSQYTMSTSPTDCSSSSSSCCYYYRILLASGASTVAGLVLTALIYRVAMICQLRLRSLRSVGSTRAGVSAPCRECGSQWVVVATAVTLALCVSLLLTLGYFSRLQC